jgi:type IV secretory pathway TrbD component
MSWVEVFAVLLVSHLTGDYLLQTEWQALHKRGGLGPNRESRRALVAHITTYTLAFVPAFVWLATDIGWAVIAAVAAVAVPHLIQDDGRLLAVYVRHVKGFEAADNPPVTAAVDQTFHFLALFALALVVGD